jgi:hypothetical protein
VPTAAQIQHAGQPDKEAVLTKAVLRAADGLGLTSAELAAIIGVSAATASRMKHGAARLRQGAKSFELAVLLVRLYRALYAIAGGDENTMKGWMRAANTALGGAPAGRIRSVTGLADAVAYLDSRRAAV